MTTDIKLCSDALVLLGENAISSFDDGSDAETMGNLYEMVVEDLLSSYRWRFASTEVALTRIEVPTVTRWASAWQLPIDLLNIHKIHTGDPDYPVPFDVYIDQLVCNEDGENLVVYCDMTLRVEEAMFRPYFKTALIYALAAAAAMPVTGKESVAGFYANMALDKLMKAKLIESQGRTTPNINTSRLVRARAGSRGYRGDVA